MVAFLELQLDDAFAWPVQHFVWPSSHDFVAGAVLLKHSSVFESLVKKRSLWKSGSSVLANVPQHLLVLEIRIFSFRGSLPENAPFRTSGSSFVADVSRKTCLLEVTADTASKM